MTTEQQDNNKHLLVLARNEPVEAMRVASGLTIIGHTVDLVFMNRILTNDEAESEHADLLELCEIEPGTTVEAMQEYFPLLDNKALASQMNRADIVISL